MNTKLSRIKETLKSVLAQFQAERITTDKGVIDVQKAGDEIAVGDTVMGVDEEGNTVALEAGEYILTDGTVLKVEDGKIAEIVEPEKEPAEEDKPAEEEAPAEEEKPAEEPEAEKEEEPEEEPAEEKDEPAEEEPKEEEAPAEEEKPAEEPEVENPTNEGEESETEAVVKLREEVNELYKVVDELTKRLDAIEKKPAADRATEEFAKVNKIGKTGNEKLDRLAKFVNA